MFLLIIAGSNVLSFLKIHIKIKNTYENILYVKNSSSRKRSDWWYRWWVNMEKSWLKLQNPEVSAISGRDLFWDSRCWRKTKNLCPSSVAHPCLNLHSETQDNHLLSYCFLSSSWHLKIRLMLLISSIWWVDVTHLPQIFSEGWAHGRVSAAGMIPRS